ncbi:hypothetical protein OCU04_013151 [Sclerotinia nivalis]|uniref:Uncharacterized protein n=1 Tax=Sclerotinia nivalis TaxID=352851 RepID=A0A9X0DEL5_9HELO|nr:hypothetical protein OCU04_013151 [Sclerotinia nivalis]
MALSTSLLASSPFINSSPIHQLTIYSSTRYSSTLQSPKTKKKTSSTSHLRLTPYRQATSPQPRPATLRNQSYEIADFPFLASFVVRFVLIPPYIEIPTLESRQNSTR